MKPAPNTFKSAFFGIALSLVIHMGAATYISGQKAPEFAFEFEIPMEIELGMSDEMTLAAEAEAPETAPEPIEAASTEAAVGLGASADAGPADAGVDQGPRDRGVRDAGVDLGSEDSGPEDTGVEEAEDAGPSSTGDDESNDQRIPPGAQIAFRMDMPAIRSSTLAPQVRQLLTQIPDWELLLSGSGIEPMADLDRLLIATPNLRRENFVMAGRHAHPEEGRAFIDATVARMHESQGRPVRWRRQDGVDIVDWPNIDRTARVLAVVGPHHFIIARERDLPRVLAIAQTRIEREREDITESEEDGETPPALSGTAADALLSMGESQAISLEIEGIHRFVAGASQRRPGAPIPDIDVLPTRISMGMRDTGSAALLDATAFYRDSGAAAEGLAFFTNEVETRTAAAPAFLRGFFTALSLTQDEDELLLRYEATYTMATIGFGLAQGWLRSQRRNGARSTAGSMQPSSPSMGTMSEPSTAEPSMAASMVAPAPSPMGELPSMAVPSSSAPSGP